MSLNQQSIAVNKVGSIWTISNSKLTIQFDEFTLALTVRQTDGTSWNSQLESDDAIIASAGDTIIKAKLSSARSRQASEYRTGWCAGVRAVLSEIAGDNGVIDARVIMTVALENEREEFVCEVNVEEGNGTGIEELAWPYGFELPKAGKDSYTVWPNAQGMLAPSDWDKEIALVGGKWLNKVFAFMRAMRMPWWGQIKNGRGNIAIIETPYDATCQLSHPAGGPTHTRLAWINSLGHFSYRRVIRFVFFEKADYVTLAKRYRRYSQGIGRWRSLASKAAANSRLELLHGGAIYHANIMTNVQPGCRYYGEENLPHYHAMVMTNVQPGNPSFDKEYPEANMRYVTFAQCAAEIKEIAARSGLYGEFHLDGWGVRGFDNLHPDIFPPCEVAGGWEGMRSVAEACKEAGWLFAVHDEYRDYYLDAPSFDYDLAARGAKGNYITHGMWAGGLSTMLCSSQVDGFMRRNLDTLAAGGVDIQGIYLDIFTCNEMDECSNLNHPATREQCADYRMQSFTECHARGLVVSSEEGPDYAMHELELVHFAPYVNMGVNCPLLSLVYHDALIVPWTGPKWNAPTHHGGLLLGLLHGGLGYIGTDQDSIENCQILAKLNKRIGWLEMTNHEYLDGNYQRQRTTFADGTTVEVDFDTGEYKITPEL